jgi:hypothetical protein
VFVDLLEPLHFARVLAPQRVSPLPEKDGGSIAFGDELGLPEDTSTLQMLVHFLSPLFGSDAGTTLPRRGALYVVTD